MLLEDLHWADAASLDLLRYLARQLREEQLLLIATYREDELTRRHPLAILLPRMTRESQAERLRLRPLDHAAIRTLVDERYALSSSDAQLLVAHLTELSEGNPFFVQSLLTSLEDDGILTRRGAQWMLDALPVEHLPPLVQEVVEARLAVLPDDVRERLEGAAVLGHDVVLESWQRLTGASVEELIDVVEQAVSANVLTESGQADRLRFTHALVREALVQGITPLQRRVWHRQVADTLLASERPDPDDIAYHLHEAGDDREAMWLIRAGLRAERAYAAQTACERYEGALRILDGDQTQQRECGWLQYRIGCVKRFSHPREAFEYLTSARRTGEAVQDEALQAFALYGEGLVGFGLGETDRGAQQWLDGITMTEALAAHVRSRMYSVNHAGRNFWPDAMPDVFELETTASREANSSPPEQSVPDFDVTARSALAGQLVAVGRISEAQRLLEPLDDLEERLQTTALHGNRGFLMALLGQFDQAWTESEKARRDPQEEPMLRLRAMCAQLSALTVPYKSDDLDERNHVRATVVDISRGVTESLPPSWSPELFVLPLDLIEGRWQGAKKTSLNVIWEDGRPHDAQFLRVPLAEIAAYQGNRQQFLTHLNGILPDGPETSPGAISIIPALRMQQLSANLALEDGDLATARAWLEARDRWINWSGIVLGRAEGLLGWAAYLHAAGALPSARLHSEQALAAATDPRQPLVLLAAHRFLGLLDRVEGRLDDARRQLDTSLALAEACAAPFERALTVLELAHLDFASGEFEKAKLTLAEVRTIAEQLDAKPTLERVVELEQRLSGATPSYPAGLTAREVDVLRLVAQGMSDAQVADELYISPRTVSTHLTSIYTKLQVSSRTAAAIAARDLALV